MSCPEGVMCVPLHVAQCSENVLNLHQNFVLISDLLIMRSQDHALLG